MSDLDLSGLRCHQLIVQGTHNVFKYSTTSKDGKTVFVVAWPR
jgi:hypothetical protein